MEQLERSSKAPRNLFCLSVLQKRPTGREDSVRKLAVRHKLSWLVLGASQLALWHSASDAETEQRDERLPETVH